MSTPSLLAHGNFSGRAAGLGLAALGAIAFSGKAIIVKLAYRHGVDAVTLIMYRMLFALPCKKTKPHFYLSPMSRHCTVS